MEKIPTLEQIEKIGFRQFIQRCGQATHTGAYSTMTDVDKALSLIGQIEVIARVKGITVREYLAKDNAARGRFYTLCGLWKDEERYEPRGRPKFYPD